MLVKIYIICFRGKESILDWLAFIVYKVSRAGRGLGKWEAGVYSK